MTIAERFIREQGTDSVADYRKRVRRLALIYSGIVITATIAIILIVLRGKLFVTLSQRSNVETLTLAVILLLFAYLIAVSAPGAWGALKILYYNLPGRFGRDRTAVEARKQASLTHKQGPSDPVYLNCLVRLVGHGDTPITIPLQDEAGSLGSIVIDNTKMTHVDGPKRSPNSTFAYFEQRIRRLVNERDPHAEVHIVEWATINDEPALKYESLVKFSCNLERHLKSPPLWPLVEITTEDLETLTREGSELCPILRNEAYLPDMEYSVQHQLPIIPEPLAFISLSREEQRADPVASMGCALIVTTTILALVVLFIFAPPWVPGK